MARNSSSQNAGAAGYLVGYSAGKACIPNWQSLPVLRLRRTDGERVRPRCPKLAPPPAFLQLCVVPRVDRFHSQLQPVEWPASEANLTGALARGFIDRKFVTRATRKAR